MIGIVECRNCNRMIDIDTQVETIKVIIKFKIDTCYLMMCKECQIDAKNSERDIKLNKVLRRTTIERIVNFVNSVMKWLR